MKKRIIAMLFAASLAASTLTGCSSEFTRTFENVFENSDVTYQASTRFLYSTDGGASWSETIQEVNINETYYLAIEMQIAQSEETNDEKVIVATITIPSTNVLDCYLDDHPGVSITGNVDAVTNSVSYDFDIVAGVSPNKFRVVFECKPLEEGRTTVEVVYDDNVSATWDATGTIKYVAASEANESIEEDESMDESVDNDGLEENIEDRDETVDEESTSVDTTDVENEEVDEEILSEDGIIGEAISSDSETVEGGAE